MVETLGGRGPGVGVELEHRSEEVGELAGLAVRPLVLLGQDLVQAPGLEARDVLKLALLVEEGSRVATR